MSPLGDAVGGVPPRRRLPLLKAILVVLGAAFFVLFVALGTWQVKRRAWKLDLIARVEQRVHAPAVPAPGPAQWPEVTAAAAEYRHVTATGTFLDSSQTLVQAVTDLGAGYWVLTPLRQADGSVVLINRGFVAADDRGRVRPGAEPGTRVVVGLLRITEPRGAFLRHNNPAADQWYSRDVQAIAAARGLSHVAPYFIDAEAPAHDANAARTADRAMTAGGTRAADGARVAEGARVADAARAADANASPANPIVAQAAGATVVPTPGLTVIHFHNSHLVYAITWYTLALMTAIAIPLGMRKQ